MSFESGLIAAAFLSVIIAMLSPLSPCADGAKYGAISDAQGCYHLTLLATNFAG
jgi:hypothetical protein